MVLAVDPVRLGNRTYQNEVFDACRVSCLNPTYKTMAEYACGILHWLGNRTYQREVYDACRVSKALPDLRECILQILSFVKNWEKIPKTEWLWLHSKFWLTLFAKYAILNSFRTYAFSLKVPLIRGI